MKIISSVTERMRAHPYICCILAGAIYSLAFLNSRLFALAYVGLFLFFLVLFRERRIIKPFRHTFAFFMGALPVLYSWLCELYPFEQFGFTPFQGICIVILGVFGISAYHACVMSLISLLTRLLPDKPYLLPPAAAAIFVISEWFLNVGPLNFSWGTVALTQVAFAPLLQTASLFGCYFITFAVVTFCGYMALFVIMRKRASLVAALCALLIPVAAGRVLLAIPVKTEKEITAAAVQGNALSNEKWDSDKLESIIDTYISLANDAADNGARLIVLPESAFPTYFTSAGSISSRLSDIASSNGCTVVTGALIKDGDGKRNAMIAVQTDGSLTNFYSKRRLVPFGESMPLKPAVDFVFKVLGIKFNRVPYIAGDSPEIISTAGMNIGGLVCFDSIFPELSRSSVAAGADIIVLVTNDSWYKDSPAVYQHVSHAALRAVETGRYVVRAANTGISCFITPKGEVYGATLPLVEDITYGTVYTVATRTLYSYVGDVPLYLSLAFYAVLAAIAAIRSIKNKISRQRTKSNGAY